MVLTNSLKQIRAEDGLAFLLVMSWASHGPAFELVAWQYYTNPLVQSGAGAFYLIIRPFRRIPRRHAPRTMKYAALPGATPRAL